MGALSAMEMAQQDVDMRSALSWHLSANHYPPVPGSMIDPCIEAIGACNEGMWNEDIALPDGVFYQGKNTAPAWEIAEQHHLDFWIVDHYGMED